MNEKVYFSTFTIKIKNKHGDLQLIDKFNGVDDYYNILNDFLDEIFKCPVKEEDSKTSKLKYHLTLSEPQSKIIQELSSDSNTKSHKIIYGYFLSGVSGKSLDIKDTIENYKDILKTDPKRHASFKKLFFFFYFKPASKELYAVLQRESKFGIKGVLNKVLNKNLVEKGYLQSKLQIFNTIHGSVFQKMINNGSMKRIDFIKKNIPKTFEAFISKNGNFEADKGVKF